MTISPVISTAAWYAQDARAITDDQSAGISDIAEEVPVHSKLSTWTLFTCRRAKGKDSYSLFWIVSADISWRFHSLKIEL